MFTSARGCARRLGSWRDSARFARLWAGQASGQQNAKAMARRPPANFIQFGCGGVRIAYRARVPSCRSGESQQTMPGAKIPKTGATTVHSGGRPMNQAIV